MMNWLEEHMNSIVLGDCLDLINNIPNASIDMVLCDLPYGTTQNKWDILIPFDDLWNGLKRVAKDNACIALWAQPPFDKLLACSNLEMYRYEWIIEKTKGTGFLNAKKMPLKCHESIQIFYKKLPVYNPQMIQDRPPTHPCRHKDLGSNYGKGKEIVHKGGKTERFPRDVLKYKWDTQKMSYHPTQKPVEVHEYMIKTYTNENAIVLDLCVGSGTTFIACQNTGRNCIGFEKDEKIFKSLKKRLEHNKCRLCLEDL